MWNYDEFDFSKELVFKLVTFLAKAVSLLFARISWLLAVLVRLGFIFLRR